ncbi:hypothetical protein NBRC110019_30610 [Neptunitalea chrysea]|uniref:DUF4293 family protein n=1 Tax=Neptunitalea chrysea TaxID=1647581 RepID=A0A9W6EUX0_9FLAO|nr:DUF4293 domain-containing protein [Neptunitalea chrysea]GLB54020.1 hypothetical protein NBRC110019_30610 [Neptunitalea chrysea]
MIQRIQTLFLLAVAVLNGGVAFVIPMYTEKGTAVMVYDNITYMVLFVLSAIVAVVSITLFKTRKNQFVVNRLNMIFNLILLGLFVYWSLNLPGEGNTSEKGIGMLFPIISIVLLVLANRAIKKDEDLVKSVDRLR